MLASNAFLKLKETLKNRLKIIIIFFLSFSIFLGFSYNFLIFSQNFLKFTIILEFF